MAYPSTLDTFTTRSNGQAVDAAHVNDLQTAVAAVQGELGTDPSGTRFSTVKAHLASLRPYYNVKSYGAVGDGVTDDTTAVKACRDACIAAALSNSAGTNLVPAVMYFPAGVYLVTEAGALWDSPRTGTAATLRGVKILGEGRRVSEILYSSSAVAPANPWTNALMVLANRWRGCTVEGLSIRSTNQYQTACYMFCSATNDGTVSSSFGSGAQNDIVWDDVELRGTWHRGWVFDGDTAANQNSEQTWHRCAADNGTTFSDTAIRSGGLRAFPATQQTDQFLNYRLVNCNFEYRSGNLFTADSGGFIQVYGGSFIMGIGATSPEGGAFFKMGDIAPQTHAYDVKHLEVVGTRFEARNDAVSIIDTYWNGSSTHIGLTSVTVANNSIGTGTTAEKTLTRANHRIARFLTGSAPPSVRWTNCQLPGYIEIVTSGTPSGGRMVMDQCNFRENRNGGFNSTTLGAATSVDGTFLANGTVLRYSGGSAPKYRYRDCYGVTDAAN